MMHLDLFSGIGGFALAASWVWGEDHEIHSFVEIDPFCQKILKKHYPNTKIHSDIKDYKHDGTTIDLLTGGFPCQPFSQAGKRGGKTDDRYLWPEMLRIIREVQPTWIIGENVAGIINMGLEQVLADLESAGYQCQTFLIPACSVNAPHRRDRVWVVANTQGGKSGKQTEQERGKSSCRRNKKGAAANAGLFRQKKHEKQTTGFKQQNKDASNSEPRGLSNLRPERSSGEGCERGKCSEHASEGGWAEPWLEVATRLCGMDARIPNRVDRLKSLGNAIVPQVVVPIMQAIKDIDEPN